MKRILLALAFVASSSAFAHGKHHHHHSTIPTCADLAANTGSILTLQPVTSASNLVQAGGNLIFSATTEGVDAGMCIARVTVHAGKLVVIGLEDALKAGTCVVVGAGDVVASILQGIFGGR